MFGGKFMDTFMDKLASKFNAQEMIRANSAAEARENERLHKEVEVYKQCLQEMRQISLQNSQTADEVAELVKTSMDKIAAIQAEGQKSEEVLLAMERNSENVLGAVERNSENVLGAVKNSSDVMVSTVRGSLHSNTERVLEALEGSTDKVLEKLQADNEAFKAEFKNELMAELKKELKGQEETVHKECVKVYRNVQAVLAEETEKQTAEIIKAQSKGSKKATAALVCGILAMTFAALGLAVSLLDIFGIFAMLF